MLHRKRSLLVTVLAISLITVFTLGQAHAGKPTTAAACKQCHQPENDVVRGTMVSVSDRFRTINIAVGSLVWVIKYGDDLKLIGMQKVNDIPKEKEISVKFTGSDKTPYAVSLAVKPPVKIAAEQLINLEEVKQLVSAGPAKGNYLIVDSRPLARYNEGHIPGALSLPLDKFDSLKDKVLPKGKDRLLVFYCGGMTCRLSPESARKAEILGYTKIKVFQAGIPEWKKASLLIESEPASIREMNEKDIAYVLIDLRKHEEAAKGHIPGAVSLPMASLATSKDLFPADKSAPIILYASETTDAAFSMVRSWGYANTTVLNGGLGAWEKTNGELKSGKVETTIAYAPKPRPGEISIEEFKSIAEKGAPDKIILDVRDLDEATNGMLKGALNIPASAIKDRISEIPKDKEIITHCTTGIRAEMAYEDLKEAGLNVRFLNAIIQIDKDGRYEITKK